MSVGSVKIIAGKAYAETVVAAAKTIMGELGGEGVCDVEILYTQPLPELDVKTHPEQLGPMDESFVVTLSPEALPALCRYFARSFKKAFGVKDICTQQFIADQEMQKTCLSRAGATVHDLYGKRFRWRLEDHNPINLCYWISGNHLLPLVYYMDRIHVGARGPFGFTGLSLTPVTGKRVMKLGESIRLCCNAVDYSGPVFVTCEDEGVNGLVVTGMNFDYPEGFMSAMIGGFSPDQLLSKFFYSLWKGNWCIPQIAPASTVWLKEVSRGGNDETIDSFLFGSEYRRVDILIPYPPEYNVRVDVDLTDHFEYTYRQLEESRIRLYSQSDEVPKQEEVEENAI